MLTVVGRTGLLALLAVAVLAPAARADGALRPAACAVDERAHVQGDGCTPVRGLDDPAFHVVSPDGRFVYAPGRNSDSVAIIARDPGTGKFTAIAGPAGCVTEDDTVAGCRAAVGIDRPQGIVMSGDGRFVYVAAVYSDTVALFSRNRRTGALRQIGCFQDMSRMPPEKGCTNIEGLDGAINLAISRDGRSLYVAGDEYDTLAVFARDPKSGLLNPAGCFRDPFRAIPASCVPVPGLDGPRFVVVSRDNRSVYVAAANSNAVTAFARDPATGALTPAGCVSQPPASGTPPCGAAPGLLNPQLVTISRDGATVYASGTDANAVVALARDGNTSALAAIAAPAGCVSDFTEGSTECRAAAGLYYPLGIALTGDGLFAYTGSYGSSSIASFSRDPVNGTLSPFGPCWSATDTTNCERMDGIGRAGYVALTADERFLHVNAPDGDRLVALARLGNAGAARILSRRATAAKGVVTLRVNCPAKTGLGGCIGELRLTVRDLVGGGVVNVSDAGAYALGPGRTGRVKVKLKATALPASGRARLLAVARSHDPTGARTVATSALVVVRRA